jgi:hypothetical protein
MAKAKKIVAPNILVPGAAYVSPLLLAYGLGVDSTAAMVLWDAHGIRPDGILFADVGGEKDETYAYLPHHQ